MFRFGGDGVLAAGLSAATAAVLFMLLVLLHSRGALGGGDVKLAAALALSGNTIPRDIDAEKLQQQLKEQGAFIGRDQKVPEGL